MTIDEPKNGGGRRPGGILVFNMIYLFIVRPSAVAVAAARAARWSETAPEYREYGEGYKH